MINDSGAYIYKPSMKRSGPIEIQSEADYDKVLKWYDEGLIQISTNAPTSITRCGSPARRTRR